MMGSYCIRPIPLFKWRWDKSQWTYRLGFGQTVEVACYVWCIEGAEKKILVDAGATTEMFNVRYGIGGHIQFLEEGLEKMRLKPEDIDIIILTHLHWDHVALASKFSKAKFIVQKNELDFALDPHPAVAAGYVEDLFKNLNFKIVNGDEEVVRGIRVFLTPGHTPGGQSVAIQTAEGIAVITGFCCISDTFDPPDEVKSKGLSVVIPAIHMDVLQVYDSVLKVKEAADLIIPLHDSGFINQDRIP